MSQVDLMISFARSQLGRPYRLGAENQPPYTGLLSWDCSELVEACVWVATKQRWLDGAANQYNASRHISVENARTTKGALLFHSYPRWHVAMSLGNGSVIEARGVAYGVCVSPIGTRFPKAGLVPLINYQEVDALTNDDRTWVLQTVEKRDTVMAEMAAEYRRLNDERFAEIQRILNILANVEQGITTVDEAQAIAELRVDLEALEAQMQNSPRNLQAIAEDIARRIQS